MEGVLTSATEHGVDWEEVSEYLLKFAQTGNWVSLALMRDDILPLTVRGCALRLAAANGHVECVALLADLIIPHAPCTDALLVAAVHGEAGSVGALLDANVDVNGVTQSGGPTALHYAALRGCVDTVRALVRGGAHVHVRSGVAEHAFAVECAARYGHDAVVGLLVAALRARCESVPEAWEQTFRFTLAYSFGLALAYCATSTVALLLDAKADVEYAGAYFRPWTPLQVAIGENCADKVRLLLEARADVCNFRICYTGSLVGEAIQDGALDEIVAALLQAKAPIHSARPGNSPLMLATKAGRTAVVRQLLECKACCDLEDADYEGTTPLVASAAKSPAITAALVGAKADVNFCHADSWPPLHAFAVRSPPAELAKLVAAKARLDATDGCGRTALHVAADNANMDAVRLLLAAGCRADARDGQGQTAQDYAAFRERPDLAALIHGFATE